MADFDRNCPVCWHWTWTNEFGETIEIGNVLRPPGNYKWQTRIRVHYSVWFWQKKNDRGNGESWWNWLIRLLPVKHSSWKEGTRGDSDYGHLVIYILRLSNEYSCHVMFSETMQWDNWQRGEWCPAGGVIFGIGGRSVAILYLDYVYMVIPE